MEENNEVEFKDVKRKMIFANGGAIIGFFIVKAFVFNAGDDMFWHFFWDAVSNGTMNIDGLLTTATTSGFIKLVVGTVIGFKLGEWYENGTIKKCIDDIQKDDEDKGDTK